MPASNDAIADHKTEACPGPNTFGREERLEHVRLNIGRDARAVVHNLDNDLIVFERSTYANFAFPIDSADGVINEIGPDLVELAAMSHDTWQRTIVCPSDSHVFHFVTEHGQGALQALVN